VVRLYHIKRVSFRDGVNEEEALAVEHIVLPHRAIWSIPKYHFPTIVKTKKRAGAGEDSDSCHKIGPVGEPEGGEKSVSACARESDNYKSYEWGETFDVPKLFLASCVQHVYEGLLPVDKTFLPV
jgi:hypothetical protein